MTAMMPTLYAVTYAYEGQFYADRAMSHGMYRQLCDAERAADKLRASNPTLADTVTIWRLAPIDQAVA